MPRITAYRIAHKKIKSARKPTETRILKQAIRTGSSKQQSALLNFRFKSFPRLGTPMSRGLDDCILEFVG